MPDWITPERITAAIPLVLLVLGGIGFLIKRHLSHARHQERATLYSNLADLSVKLRNSGLSLDDLQSLELQIKTTVRQKKAAPLPRDEGPTLDVGPAGNEPASYYTNAEMIRRANAALGIADAELDAALAELFGMLDESQHHYAQASHDAWLEYRRREAELASSPYEGGSIVPLIEAFEAQAMTEERTRRVRAMVEEWRKL
jgi:uncharacterized protein YecT (DUF1311 family)